MLYNSFKNLLNKNNNLREKDKIKSKLSLFSKEQKSNKKINFPKKAFSNELKKDDDLNECILNKNCPYYNKYIKLNTEIESLFSSREKLKTINHSLYLAFSEKNQIYKEVKEENNYLRALVYKLTGLKFSEIMKNKISYNYNDNSKDNYTIQNKSNKTYINTDSNKRSQNKLNKIKLNLKKNLKLNSNSRNNYINDNIYQSYSLNNNINNKSNLIKSSQLFKRNSNCRNSDKSLSINFSDSNYKEDKFKQKRTNKNKRSKTINKLYQFSKKRFFNMDYNPIDYYEMINNYIKKQKLKINAKETNSSYLSLDNDLMNLLNKNITLNKLENLTKNDEKFIAECKNSTNDTLFKYCDLINSLIIDYKDIIKLSTRMKDIIKGSILLIESIISNDSSTKFIEITCDILKCDRASLFLFDRVSDKLILYTGEGMKKAQIRIDKTKGIVGACFSECRVIRIEDAYLEERFNKDVDLKTNYRTKSILCYPLVDKEGECFGVIEAINKLNSTFTDDDQELLKLLSQEASSIFKSITYHDDYRYLVSKLFIIVDYSIKIQYIKNKNEFSRTTEETLLNLFGCMDAALYFIEENHAIRYSKEDEYKTYDINFGIVGKVIKFKEIIGYKNIKYSEEYNSIIDIKSFDGLLTFPILAKKTKKVCAVVQVPYFGEINKFGKPKENEAKVIKKFCKCIKNWIYMNE